MKLLMTGLIGLLTPVSGTQSDPSLGAHRTLYLFLSPEAPGQDEIVRRAVDYTLAGSGKVRLRSVLLVNDFSALGRVKDQSPFTRALKELGRLAPGPLDLAVYDEEGLVLARTWKITRLPTIVLVAEGRAHVASGSRAKPEDLEECR